MQGSANVSQEGPESDKQMVGQMAQWVRSLVIKCEDLSPDAITHGQLGMATCTYNPVLLRVETGGPLRLAGYLLSSGVIESPCVVV